MFCLQIPPLFDHLPQTLQARLSNQPLARLEYILAGIMLWASVDERLCSLAARLDNVLEVEFRLIDTEIDVNKYDLTEFLSGFRTEGGVVTITDPVPGSYFLTPQPL
jgi:hypothetical protein